MRTSPLLLTIAFASALSPLALSQTVPSAAKSPSAEPPAAATQPFAPVAVVARPAAAPATPAAQPAGSELKVKDAEPTSRVTTKSGGKDASGHDTITVNFPDDDIRSILRNVADLFDLNLVIPESLQGKTSIQLHDVTWRQIYQNVLSPVGYTYIEDGSIIKIVSNESLLQEPTTTEVFILNYARAADILPTISSLVDTGAAGGKIVVEARSNALVITERPSRFNRIRPIIESLDRATDQVMIESKFVEVTDRDVRNLGVNWTSLSGQKLGIGSGNTNGQFGSFNRTQGQTYSNGLNGTSNSTNGTTGSTSNTSNSTQNSGSTNANAVTATGGAVTGTSSTGSTGDLSNALTGTTQAATNAASTSALDGLRSLTNTGGTDRLLNAVFTASDFNVVLSALSTLDNTRIVSNPTIVTLNNTEATINVGEEFPIPQYAYNEQRGSFEVNGFQYRPIGVLLKVTPQVNSRGFVKLILDPEVSQRNGETTFGGAGGASIPIIATRKAHTQVSLKDGSTLGIGGLVTKSATNGSSKVPFLGDIPLLGNAFKSKNKNETNTNLLIFITAKVVSSDGATIEQVFNPGQVRDLQLRESDLPGYREKTSALLPPEAPAPVEKKPFFRLTTPESKASK